MPYGLIVNGTLKTLIDDAKYLLSPQDLMAIDLVPELIKAGVKSFKIEGRLKGPEYVAITTKAYREAVDAVWTQLYESEKSNDPNLSEKRYSVSKEMRNDLTQVYFIYLNFSNIYS